MANLNGLLAGIFIRSPYAVGMRLMLTIFALVLALIVDQVTSHGHYREKAAGVVRSGIYWLDSKVGS